MGTIDIYDGSNKIGSYNLVVNEAVKKESIFRLLLDNFKDIIIGDLIG